MNDTPTTTGRGRLVILAFVTGCLIGTGLVILQAGAVGGWKGLLSVGAESALRPFIETNLGPVPLASGSGHDGQIGFAIALDLDGSEIAPLLDAAGYRFRRILYPALASGGGMLGGTPLLVSFILLQALFVGGAVAAVADIILRLHLPAWVLGGIAANPGVWLGAWLLTSDVPAICLACVAVDLALRSRWVASAAVAAAAALTKDVYIVVAFSLAFLAWRELGPRRASAYIAGATLPLGIWSAVVAIRLGGGFTPRGNLGWPLLGIARSIARWGSVSIRDLVFGMTALVATGILCFLFFRLTGVGFRAFAAPWIVIALSSSTWVWDFGNNAIRALAPVVLLVVAGLGLVARSPGSTRLTDP